MRSKLLVLIAAGLAILLGCVETTGVEAPPEAYPNTPFQTTVNTIASDSTGGYDTNGCLAVLIPDTWIVDSMYVNGYGYSGPMEWLGWEWEQKINFCPSDSYPPSPGYGWYLGYTPYCLTGNIGDTGQAIVNIIPNDSLGTFQMAFLAVVYYGGIEPEYVWDGDPCSCMVEITPLNLKQTTWGCIKVEF